MLPPASPDLLGQGSLDKPFTAPHFFLLEMVLPEEDIVFFFLGLVSFEGDTGVRLRGDRRTAVTPRPLAGPAETELATVSRRGGRAVAAPAAVAVPAVAVPAVAVPAVEATTAVPAVAVPADVVTAVADPAAAVPALAVPVPRVRARARSKRAGDEAGGDYDLSRAWAFAFLVRLAASLCDRCLRRSIQLSNTNQVVSGQDEQITQVRDREHFVCLEQEACAVHGSKAEGLVVKLPQGL